MKAQGYKIITQQKMQELMERYAPPATLQDALQTEFKLLKSYWYYWDDGKADCTKADKYRIVYQVETPFSDS